MLARSKSISRSRSDTIRSIRSRWNLIVRCMSHMADGGVVPAAGGALLGTTIDGSRIMQGFMNILRRGGYMLLQILGIND